MPTIKSAAKRMRQTQTRTLANLRLKRIVKQATRDAHDAAAAKDDKKFTDASKRAQSAIDKAVKKGLYHKNKAARKKAQLATVGAATFGTVKTKKTAAKKAAPKKTAPKSTSKASTTTKKPAPKKTAAKKPAAKKNTTKKS